MRTEVPAALPIFRSDMQVRLLALLLLQPERAWTLNDLAETLDAPASSVHRELSRAEAAGIVERDGSRRPHVFRAAHAAPLFRPLADLMRMTVGVEEELRRALDRPDVVAAVIHGSWVTNARRPDSDIDVLVVGEAALPELRRVLRPIGEAAGRSIDLMVLSVGEFRALVDREASLARRLLDGPIVPLKSDLSNLARSWRTNSSSTNIRTG